MLRHNVSSCITHLDKLSRTLPTGSKLHFHGVELNEDGWDGIVLDLISIPPEAPPGVGTRLMADLLAATDRLGVKVRLEADPTRKRGDPSLFDLAKWYYRFGFRMQGLMFEGWLILERDPQKQACDATGIIDSYQAAKANQDLTREEFERRVDVLVSIFQSSYGEEWANQFRERGY